jgi:hypothetical protein
LPSEVFARLQAAAVSFASSFDDEAEDGAYSSAELLRPFWPSFCENEIFKKVYFSTLAVYAPSKLLDELKGISEPGYLEHFFHAQCLARLGSAADATCYLAEKIALGQQTDCSKAMQLLLIEMTIDTAVETDSEGLKAAQLRAAAAELASCEVTGPEYAERFNFLRSYLAIAQNSNGDRQGARDWCGGQLEQLISLGNERDAMENAPSIASLALKLDRFHPVWCRLNEIDLEKFSRQFKNSGASVPSLVDFLDIVASPYQKNSSEEIRNELRKIFDVPANDADEVVQKLVDAQGLAVQERESREKDDQLKIAYGLIGAGVLVMILAEAIGQVALGPIGFFALLSGVVMIYKAVTYKSPDGN